MTPKAFIFLAGFFLPAARAAHSRRRFVGSSPSQPKYDRSITTFSPDGRLEQVEYGSEASSRGSPVAALRTDAACVVVAAPGTVHRIDHHLWMVSSGLSGDGRFLAAALRRTCQRLRAAHGEPARTEQVARMAGGMQHQLTYTGGARPLGCTAILFGVDDGVPRMFQTDPGGVVEEVVMCAAGKGRKELLSVLDSDFGTFLEYDEGTGNDGDESLHEELEPIEMARSLARIVCQELERNERRGEKTKTNIWMIEPDAIRRGGMRATCFERITSENIGDIVRPKERGESQEGENDSV